MQINGISVAINHMEKMVNFYNAVFDAGLHPAAGSPFFAGTLCGMDLTFVPNSILEINAERSRFQLRLVVDDLDAMIQQAEANGGRVFGERYEADDRIVWGICDPEDNSFELIVMK